MQTRTKTRAALTGALTLAAAWLLPGAYAQDAPATPPATTAPGGTTPAPTATDPGAPTTAPDASTGTVDVPAVTVPAPPPISSTSGEDSDKPKSRRFRFGPEVGVYLPTNSKTRDRFGSTWLSVGLGLGPITGVSRKGQLGFDLSLQYQQHDDNRVFLLPVGLGYRVALSQNPEAKNVPYAGVTADVYIADVRSVPDNVHSGIHEAGGGSVLVGVNFGQSGNLEARYQLVSHLQSFDFSGLSLRAGYRF